MGLGWNAYNKSAKQTIPKTKRDFLKKIIIIKSQNGVNQSLSTKFAINLTKKTNILNIE